MKKRIIKQESPQSKDVKVLSSKKTNDEISNSFLRKIISLLKKEELI